MNTKYYNIWLDEVVFKTSHSFSERLIHYLFKLAIYNNNNMIDNKILYFIKKECLTLSSLPNYDEAGNIFNALKILLSIEVKEPPECDSFERFYNVNELKHYLLDKSQNLPKYRDFVDADKCL